MNETFVTHSLRVQVQRHVRLYLKIAERRYGRKFWMPEIIFSSLGTDAGQADHFNWRIYLNARLLVRNREKFLIDTIPHEVGHLVNPVVNVEKLKEKKLSPHGQEWIEIMQLFGVKPNITHDYDCKNLERIYHGAEANLLVVRQTTQICSRLGQGLPIQLCKNSKSTEPNG